MSPRFPQELFDYIIDQEDSETLKACSTVCKQWTFRSRRHLFEVLYILIPADLNQWCESIPPAVDGPSKHVKRLIIHRGVVPLIRDPQPLDPYLDHFSALTQVIELELYAHRGPVHLDMMFKCFSGFRNTLQRLRFTACSFRFEEISQIIEFFPNVDTVIMFLPTLRSDEERPIPPHRPVSFPRIRTLFLDLSTWFPAIEADILSGLAEASMDLDHLSIVGPMSDMSAVQKLVDSTARSLTTLRVSPLELDLSPCNKIEMIVVEELLHSFRHSAYFHDPVTKPQFEYMLGTVKSSALSGICVPVRIHVWGTPDRDIVLVPNDWKNVDALLCGVLLRIRTCTGDPSRSFSIGIMNCVSDRGNYPPDLKTFLPDFQAAGGAIAFFDFDDYD